MLDKIKEIMIAVGAIVVSVLVYMLSKKDEKIGELYYEAKSEAYKVKMETLETKHEDTIEVAEKNRAKYFDLKSKYDAARAKSTGNTGRSDV